MSKDLPGQRGDYAREVLLTTRWDDNDLYGHLNNAVHYRLFDTAVNGLLIRDCGFDPVHSELIGVVAESGCRYFSELQFPHPVIAGVRVGRLGNSSVRYEIGLFAEDALHAAAEGYFVHVFVDRSDRRPRPLPAAFRAGLSALVP